MKISTKKSVKQLSLSIFFTLLFTAPTIAKTNIHASNLAIGHPKLVAQSVSPQPIAQLQSQALTIYQPLQSIPWEGQFINPRGTAYFALDEYTPSSPSESGLEEARAMKDRAKEARELAKLALTYYFQDDFFKAVDYYKQSLEIAKEIGDRELEGVVLGSLGLIHAQKGFYTAETVDYLREYLEFTQQQSSHANADRRAEAVALGNLGNAYFGADLYAIAIAIHQKRLALSRQLNDRSGEAKALGDLSLVYQALGETTKAIDYQQQQLTLARQIQDVRGQSRALANLGIAYHTLADYKKAADYQQQRLTLARTTKDLKAEAEALANLAGAYYFLGDYPRAIDLYEHAWKIAWNTLHDADVLYGLRGNQGLAYFQKGDYATALEFYQQYFTYVASRENRRGQGVAKNNAAVVRWSAGNLAAAEKTLQEGLEFWESLRSRLGSNDAYKISIFDTQGIPYQNLQSVLIANKKPEAALEVAERGRARAFVDLLSRRLTLDSQQATTTSIKPPNLAQIQQIARSHNATLVTYSTISRRFKLQNTLQTREAELLSWVVKPSGEVTLRQVDLTSLWQQNLSLADLVTTSREAIGVRSRGLGVISSGSTRQSSVNRLQQLHQLLIAPIADLLPADANAQVIFIPQGALFFVPFAALQDASGKYLIEQHTLSIAPSIQVLDLTYQQRQKQKSSKARSGSLIVGNPTMPRVVVAAGQPPEQLNSLPGAEQEAKAIAQLLNTTAITGDAATKVKVVQQMQQVRFIHLATHGLLDDFRGLGVPGAIALAPSGNDDGLLTASEILNLNLAAELVVLSACDTGRGRITGDGVIGLSRSWIAAGVPSLVVSLWAVPDAPTAALMTQFYQTLQQNPNKAQALRQSMLTTLKQYPDPKDWAAFTLIGEAL